MLTPLLFFKRFFLIYIWNIWQTLFVSPFNILFNNIMMKNSDIYLIFYHFWVVYFCRLIFIDVGQIANIIC